MFGYLNLSTKLIGILLFVMLILNLMLVNFIRFYIVILIHTFLPRNICKVNILLSTTLRASTVSQLKRLLIVIGNQGT